MISVSPTMLESYRLYRDFEFISTEEMENHIKRVKTPPTHPQLLGEAFHACLEGKGTPAGDKDSYPCYGYGDYVFEAVSVDLCRLEGLPEVSGSCEITVDGAPVVIGGRADWICGNTLWDVKTSEKQITPDKPADSMQWRCYHLIFGVQKIIYRHCWLKEDEGIYTVKEWHDVPLYPYPALRKDVEALLRDMLAFAKLRGIYDSLERA